MPGVERMACPATSRPHGKSGIGGTTNATNRFALQMEEAMAENHAHLSTGRRPLRRTSMLLMSLALVVFATGAALAGAPPRHVVGGAEIQARIDRQLDQDGADRQAIQQLLAQPGVRQIATSAGLDVERAQSAAALLSGPELKDLASRAREIDAGIGGDRTITMTATTLIIILLLIIILTD